VAPNGHIAFTIRNALHDTLLLVGFGRRLPEHAGDTLRIAPSATGAFTVEAPASGVYTYFGVMQGSGKPRELGAGQQLTGVIQVGEPRPNERILAITLWQSLWDSAGSADFHNDRIFWVINGRMWPSTERFAFDVGDTVRWRIVDATGDEHPMHLHGFYFRVDGRTTWDIDSTYSADRQRLVVTEVPPPGGSVAITWVPTRPGAWLLHCHKAPHMSGRNHDALDGDTSSPSQHDHQSAEEHLRRGMGGLIIGITVRGPPPALANDTPAQRIRLLVQRKANVFQHEEGLGYVVQGQGVPASDSVQIPGPVLVLTRGALTEITVVNRLPYRTTVHWHGIELESYYDGVGGWSGATGRLAPLLAPGDSFVVRIRPPRAGTFIYHTHVRENMEFNQGLVGVLLVLEPGRRYDPATDHVLMLHVLGNGDSALVVVNGKAPSAPLVMAAGVKQRLRFVTMTADDATSITLQSDSTPLTWRPVAKDGAVLPPAYAVPRIARVHLNPGETFDAEFTPARGGLSLEVKSFNNFSIPILVR
jgi:FtsP/CotA-like multicopper oxidase with cupredoxin domain